MRLPIAPIGFGDEIGRITTARSLDCTSSFGGELSCDEKPFIVARGNKNL
jgi:hypothetical protein